MSKSKTEQLHQAAGKEAPKQGAVKTYGRWQLFYLDRLEKLATTARDVPESDMEDFEAKALKRAIFSTLLLCDRLGIGEEARNMVASSSVHEDS